MVLEKTLESPLDCKEIHPVHSEGDEYVGELLEVQQGCEGPFGVPEVGCD